MQIENKNPDELKPFDKNPQNHPDEQIDKLVDSIEEYGFTNLILTIDHEGEDLIIAGHARVKAAKEKGLREVPTIKLDLDYEQAMAYNIADNKLTEMAEWDDDLLGELMEDLEDADVDVDSTGFSDDEISELLDQNNEAEEDEFEEPDEVDARCEKGQVWKLGEHRLMCGDATSEEDVDKLMDGSKADMVFTDPPYNALNSWDKDEANAETRLDPSDWFDNDNMSWEEFDNFLKQSFNNFSGHSSYICCDFRIYPRVADVIEQNTNYEVKHCIVWKKNVWGLGKRYRFQHEFIVYACKEEAPFFGNRSQSDVWEVDVDRTTEHNTPKPVELMFKGIKNSSKRDGIVYDCFGGSGSTLIACEQLDRACYMMEIDPEYCEVIMQRWEELTDNEAELVEDA